MFLTSFHYLWAVGEVNFALPSAGKGTAGKWSGEHGAQSRKLVVVVARFFAGQAELQSARG